MQTLQVFLEKVFTIGRWHENYFIDKKKSFLYLFVVLLHRNYSQGCNIYFYLWNSEEKM